MRNESGRNIERSIPKPAERSIIPTNRDVLFMFTALLLLPNTLYSLNYKLTIVFYLIFELYKKAQKSVKIFVNWSFHEGKKLDKIIVR